jgi:hypothetical protein
MLLIPELEVVVILVPRTGTTALKNAVLARYPKAMQLYRHMEADGVPQGYDRWSRMGVVREPVARLWSLYKYLRRFGIDYCQQHDDAFTAAQRASVDRPFEDWLINNERVFTGPYDSAGLGRFWPAYTVRHPLPENRKSQFIYLRPDLGTQVVPYTAVEVLYHALDIDPPRVNGTDASTPPELSDEGRAYVDRWFRWDFEATTNRSDHA